MWIDVGITKINHPPNHHNRRYKPFTHGWFMALFYLHCIVFDEIKKRYPSRPFPLHFPQTFDLFFSAQEFDSGGAGLFLPRHVDCERSTYRGRDASSSDERFWGMLSKKWRVIVINGFSNTYL